MKLNLNLYRMTGISDKLNDIVDKAKETYASVTEKDTVNHKDNLFSESLKLNTLTKELDYISKLAVSEDYRDRTPEIGIVIASIIPKLHSISEQITWEASYLKD